MDAPKIIVSTIAATIFIFAMNFVWYGVLMSKYFSSVTDRDQPYYLYIVFGTLIFSFMFSYLYPKGVEGDARFVQGLRYGISMAILISLPAAFINYATNTEVTLLQGLIDVLFWIVVLGITGMIVANVSGMPSLDE
jgi:hypothetical protein